MATHGALRTDLLDPQSIFDKRLQVLVPGPNWPQDPRDLQLETITYCDPESVREFADKLALLQRASTLGIARDGDTIYQDVFFRAPGGAHTLYAANPDDPTSPTTISITSGALVAWQDEGVATLSSATANLVGAGVTLTDVAGVATITIPGGSTVNWQEEGAAVVSSTTANFVGAGATVTDVGGVATITIPATSVTAGNLIDVTGTQIDVDLTELAFHDPTAAFQAITHISGTQQWGLVYNRVQDEGVNVIQRATLNFAGAGVSVADTGGVTTVTISGGGGGSSLTAGQYIDLTGGTAIDVDLVEVPGYAADFLMGAPTTPSAEPKDAVFRSIKTWLTKLDGYSASITQSIGNQGSGPEWQADGVC